ncbi:cupin domain-containing protein [Noviherbaspirillum sp.]|uniref:cupin domain-containing protein n=1 Tax=Noviherbaspirillum sp. TaxID=1926288 RepID=UPI002FE29795
MNAHDILEGIPALLPAEISESLVTASHVRIERIVSRGQCSPPGFWYEQVENEWVMVIKGEAELRVENVDGGDKTVRLTEGMYVDIPAGVRHRVDWTSPDTDTVWLAVFY